MNFGEEGSAAVDWVDQSRLHFRCRFIAAGAATSCTYTYLLYAGDASSMGVDLSRFRHLNLGIRYSGSAHNLRVAIRSFDPRFSRVEDSNSPKFNMLNVRTKDLVHPVAIDLHQFSVPDWWVAQYDLPRELSQPDMSNATAFSIFLQNEQPGSEHEVRIDKIEFSGDWISAESWYLGILCTWMVLVAGYGMAQWLKLRRRHRELQHEKDKYQKLSTIDGLTGVMNRHGISHFLAPLKESGVATSVIVIDLDHFKRINDHRGHVAGDRVLQTVGEILRTHTRDTDGLGRWGGEEFVLICPGSNLTKAANLAEKLRVRIMQANFIPEDPVAVTASFGVAVSAGGNFDQAFEQADQALYLAKNRGRNCVVAAGEDQMHKVTGARRGTWALISGRFKIHNTSRAKEN
jgi:diguanylate cyclase (GGDEF)-like protein